MAKATIGGGYQPDTRSSSARRADFDLLRRISLLEAGGGGGGGGGTDEVWIGPNPPTDPNIELWYDTDATGSPVTVPLSYVHNQGVASATWVITHNLGFYPNVIVEDSGGTTVEGEVVYNSANQLTLTFSAPFGGIAYLS